MDTIERVDQIVRQNIVKHKGSLSLTQSRGRRNNINSRCSNMTSSANEMPSDPMPTSSKKVTRRLSRKPNKSKSRKS